MGWPRMGGPRWREPHEIKAKRNFNVFGVGQLGRRLALAFIAVALAAIAVNAPISAERLCGDINRVAMQQENSLAQAVAATSGAAYQGTTWKHADLDPVFRLAARGMAAVQVRDNSGRVVGSMRRFHDFPQVNQTV